MPTTPFTMRVEPELKAALEAEAKRAQIPASQVATQAIRAHLEGQAAERAAIATALKEADQGRFVTYEAMTDWINSWDTDIERAPPNAQ